MSLSTYSDLQNGVASWLSRDDLSANIIDFITLFEAAANRRLRVRQQETTASLTTISGDVTLPTDYLAWRRVTWPGSSRRDLDYVEPSYLQSAYPTSSSGIPRVFTIEGSTLKVRPSDDSTAVEFLYFAKVPALSAGNTTNWLLTAHPDVYLFGSLAESQMFTEDDQRGALWKARRDEIFDEIEKLSNKSRGAGNMRVLTATP